MSKGNSLEEFSNVIHRMAEERRIEEDRQLEEMTSKLPEMIRKIESLTNEVLLNDYDTCLNGCYSNPSFMDIMVQYKNELRKEILERFYVHESPSSK